jgi:hypothetical protein
MEKIFRSMGDGIVLAFNGNKTPQNNPTVVTSGQSETSNSWFTEKKTKFKRWLSYEPSKHYLGAGKKKHPHK